MNTRKYLAIILIFTFLYSCNSEIEIIDIIGDGDENEVVINCTNTDIIVTAEDNIVINHATNPIIWNGTYNENNVSINYTKPVSTDGETETFKFIFNKVDECLKVERAFKFYDGKEIDVSAVTEINVSEFLTKEWEIDEKFSGQITYKDPHDKQIYSRKFWLEFTEDDLETENTNYLFFDSCFSSKLPIDIDINKDGIIDYKVVSEKIRDIGNTPKYNQYTIKLISTFEEDNQILSPRKNQPPYSVIFEPPFTSENKRQYFNDVKNALDVFYEFDAPYQVHNYFLNNKLTYKDFLENNIDDYYIIKMRLNNKEYYGWIKLTFNANTCAIEILDTYLDENEGVHISVEN